MKKTAGTRGHGRTCNLFEDIINALKLLFLTQLEASGIIVLLGLVALLRNGLTLSIRLRTKTVTSKAC